MLGAFAGVMMLISIAAGAVTGRLPEVSRAAAESCGGAVMLTLTLAGTMALWGGIMAVAEAGGITGGIEQLLRPAVRLLFPGADDESRRAVSMNLTAGLLGLGNAATPLGIRAAKSLKTERDTAVLVVLNTASIQLIPTTMAALRAANGSAEPYEIMLPVLTVSFIAAAAGCTSAAVLFGGEKE